MYIYTFLCVYMYIYIFIDIHMYIYTFLCIYIYILRLYIDSYIHTFFLCVHMKAPSWPVEPPYFGTNGIHIHTTSHEIP